MKHEGVNLIGFATGNFGLSVYTRHIAKLLSKKEIPFCIIDVPLEGKRCSPNDYSEYSHLFSNVPTYPTNLFVFGADFATWMYPQLKDKTKMSERYNVYIPFWEVFEYNDSFINLSSVIDMFLAPTSFIKYSLMRSMSNSRIDYLAPSVNIKDKTYYTPYRKNKMFKFYYNFDVGSSFERKNPMPLIRAFRELFGNNENVELILKVGNCDSNAENYFKQHGGKNTVVFTKYLSYEDNLKLLNSSDCYVSTHRSEGLGQGLYEAMKLGIPTISTAYGGNLDFMDNGSSYLLKYATVPVNCNLYKSICPKPNTWAEVDYEDLKRGMKLMYDNEEYRNTIIHNGYKKINHVDSQFWNTDVFDSIEDVRRIK